MFRKKTKIFRSDSELKQVPCPSQQGPQPPLLSIILVPAHSPRYAPTWLVFEYLFKLYIQDTDPSPSTDPGQHASAVQTVNIPITLRLHCMKMS